MRVVVVGSTGLIGRRLVSDLVTRGDDVLAVSRSGCDIGQGSSLAWEGPRQPLPSGLLDGADAVINLAGAPLAGRRWSASYKKEIRISRVDLTKALADAVAADPAFSGAFLSASAVGYYGPSDGPLDEASQPGHDYLAGLCADWEAAVTPAAEAGARVVLLRTGLVLADEGPLLPKLATLSRALLGGSLGSGRQWFPWIHIDDEVGLILWALDSELSGPLNLVAPGVVRQRRFADVLRTVVGRSFGLPTPAFALKLALGEAAEPALTGQRPAPRVALDRGYHFEFPELEPALRDLVS